MSYESTLEFIHSKSWKKHKNGLDRIRTLLDKLGNPQKKLKFIHVAGTNGKGSTCSMLDAVLRKAGYKTGLFTSPYIYRFNERMRVNGMEIPDDTLEEICDEIRAVTETMDEKPSEFEIVCAIGMVWFLRENCDIVVLEVGLGGEFDSTNVIDAPECAVITAIGLDHTEMLGNTIALVASAKAGIIKHDCDVITFSGEPDADEVFRKTCVERNARLAEIQEENILVARCDSDGSLMHYGEMRDIYVPLAGTYQPRNAALAIETLRLLARKGWALNDEIIRDGIAEAKWPGRFEKLGEKPEFILDGAHNPHGIRAAADSLKTCYPGKRFVFLLGAMRDKAIDEILDNLLPIAEGFVATRPDIYRAMSAEELALRVESRGASCIACPEITEAVRTACRIAGEDGVVCALGSLYFSADIHNALLQK